MGEAIHCNMEVRTPTTWSNDVDKPPWFVQLFYDDMYEFTDIDAIWLSTGEIGGWTMSGWLNYGSNSEQAAQAMEIMRELHVPFIFVEEGHPEWSGQLEIHTGIGPSIERVIDEASNIVLDQGTWNRIRQANTFTLEELTLVDEVALVRAVDAFWAASSINIDDLAIDHLPELCPPDPEGRLATHLDIPA